jgi:hypothetical protein
MRLSLILRYLFLTATSVLAGSATFPPVELVEDALKALVANTNATAAVSAVNAYMSPDYVQYTNGYQYNYSAFVDHIAGLYVDLIDANLVFLEVFGGSSDNQSTTVNSNQLTQVGSHHLVNYTYINETTGADIVLNAEVLSIFDLRDGLITGCNEVTRAIN